MSALPFAREYLEEILDYDPETGVFTWKERPVSHFSCNGAAKIFATRYAGKEAGRTRHAKGYYKSRMIKIGGREYLAHRLAWLLMTGDQPPKEIDHINRDATDNRWKNLRDGTQINNKSRLMSLRNTSGVTGVSWHKKDRRWRVMVKSDGKCIFGGNFKEDDLDLAAMEVMEMRAERGFDPTHGLYTP